MTNQQPPDLTLRQAPPDYQDDEIDLRDLLGTLIDAKWLILAATLGVLSVGVAYALLATPIYRSDALLQVEKKNTSLSGLDEISSMLTGETPAEAEIEIIRSRTVMGAAVDQLKLDIVAEPHHFPVIGAALARRYTDEVVPAEPLLGLLSYAWGGERIQVERLELPTALQNEQLTLVAGEQGHYELYDPDGQLLLSGEVGKPAASSAGAGVSIYVARLEARAGTRFAVTKRPRTQVVRELQETLKVGEKGKKTGVMQVALEGAKPERIAAIVDAVATLYLRQNVERRSEEAQKMLEFLNGQLPELKANLNVAEAALNDYRSKKGTVDLSLEAQSYLKQQAEIETQISVLDMQRAELAQKFTARHPTLVVLEQKAARLKADREAVNAQFKNLPEAEQEALRLARDATVANELYVLLLNKAQELKIAKAGAIGNVRILDPALLPDKPIKPKKGLVAALSLVLGLMLGVFVAFARRALRKGVEDPDQVEAQLGLPVYAVIPRSENMCRLERHAKRKALPGPGVLAAEQPKDLAIEGLRSLRTSLQFALLEAKNNIIAIGGPAPGIGKSFISLNLAYVVADAGKRVLLIDGDMRKGHLHDGLGLERSPGLSELIAGELPLDKVIRATGHANVRFLATGILPPNPSELLLSARFTDLLKDVAAQYDLVIIDSPPILAVADAGIISRHAGANLLVVRYGVNTVRELQAAIKRLEQSGSRVQGVIFNDMARSAGAYGYGKYGHYHYQYDSK